MPLMSAAHSGATAVLLQDHRVLIAGGSDANGVSIGTPGVVKDFRLVQVVSGTVTTLNETVDSTTPDTAFRWDPIAQQWIFNISNKGLYGPNQTYYFLITLNDGTTIPLHYGLK